MLADRGEWCAVSGQGFYSNCASNISKYEQSRFLCAELPKSLPVSAAETDQAFSLDTWIYLDKYELSHPTAFSLPPPSPTILFFRLNNPLRPLRQSPTLYNRLSDSLYNRIQ